MITWGINALNHGSSLSVFNSGRLLTFEQSASDKLDSAIIRRAVNYGGPNTIFWYERPWFKKVRQARAGQWNRVFDFNDLPSSYVKTLKVPYAKLQYTPHHASHAAAGYYTSPFNHCAIVVLDAIGEFECATIWEANHGEIKKVWSRSYPNSLGLFYSAFTQLIGYKPLAEEHLLQRDSEMGDSQKYLLQIRKYFNGVVSLNTNFHTGVHGWPEMLTQQDRYDIAAAVQQVFEEQVDMVMLIARRLTGSDCLVYMGGCAMNSKYNKQLLDQWKYVWSLPNPGDPSSSVGAVLYHTKQRVWDYNFGVAKHLEISV
jgi:carbamoyltransferase